MLFFKGKIWKTGAGSAVVTIPKQYIKDSSLHIGKKYLVGVECENNNDNKYRNRIDEKTESEIRD